jgi:hypothetical protein
VLSQAGNKCCRPLLDFRCLLDYLDNSIFNGAGGGLWKSLDLKRESGRQVIGRYIEKSSLGGSCVDSGDDLEMRRLTSTHLIYILGIAQPGYRYGLGM